MHFNIRQEIAKDHQAVFALTEKAFAEEAMSDHREQFLVERLRKSPAFLPELSLVALAQKEVVGHILLTKIMINDGEKAFPSLALAPVSVHPNFQGQGIGGKLILAAHERARALGFTSIVLIGHENYYPRFGYERAEKFGIDLPFPAPPENCLAIALVEGGLAGVGGMVAYPSAFFEE